MITLTAHNADWDHIAEVLGDSSWSSDNMRRYFERLEDCRYVRRPWRRPTNRLLAGVIERIPVLSRLFENRSRHGFHGWLTTSLADPTLAVTDHELLAVIVSAVK